MNMYISGVVKPYRVYAYSDRFGTFANEFHFHSELDFFSNSHITAGGSHYFLAAKEEDVSKRLKSHHRGF